MDVGHGSWSMHSASKIAGRKLHFPNWYVRPPPTHNVNCHGSLCHQSLKGPFYDRTTDCGTLLLLQIRPKNPGPDWSPKRNRGSAQTPGIPQVPTNWNAQEPTSCNHSNLKWERCHICRNHRFFWPYMTLPKRSPKTKDALGKSASLKRIDQKNYAAMHVMTLLKSEGGRVCSNPSLWPIRHVSGRIYQNERPPLATKSWGSGCSCLTTPWRFEATQLPKQNSQLNVTVLSLTILIQWSAGILKPKELPLFKITRNNSWKTFHIPKPKVPVEMSP